MVEDQKLNPEGFHMSRSDAQIPEFQWQQYRPCLQLSGFVHVDLFTCLCVSYLCMAGKYVCMALFASVFTLVFAGLSQEGLAHHCVIFYL